MLAWIRNRYEGHLLARLARAKAELVLIQSWYDGSDFNEYTEGWLNHLERRVVDLIRVRGDLMDRIDSLHPSA